MDNSGFSSWVQHLDLSIALTTVYGLVGSLVVYAISVAVYNVYFHPLSSIPGPRLYAATAIFHAVSLMRGDKPFMLHRLHQKYGDIVRYSPWHISFSNGHAYKEIYGTKPGRGQLRKDPANYRVGTNGFFSILGTPSDEDHSRYRRLLAPGFSEKAMREQEIIITSYIDLLIHRLHENATNGPQDIVAWYNWTTFDLIGDLAFDDSFQCLEKSMYHPWIQFVFGSVKAVSMISALRLYPPIYHLLTTLAKKSLAEKNKFDTSFTKQKVAARVAKQTDRTDFLAYTLRNTGEKASMNMTEIELTSSVLVLGGSETVATLLSGVTYLLLKHPEVMKRLVAEIRGKFADESEINIASVGTLTYELAVLNEALRVFPPSPIGGGRLIPPQGDTILGHQLPGKTVVLACNYAASHSSQNWKNPDLFCPERWLDDPLYKDDQKIALVPFSTGPRNCIGINLANAEMRLILTRVLWNFDMQLLEPDSKWMENLKAYILWDKVPLMVRISPVVR